MRSKGECARTAVPVPEICCLDKGTTLQAKAPNEALWVGMFTTTIPYWETHGIQGNYILQLPHLCHEYCLCYIHYFIVYFCYICDIITWPFHAGCLTACVRTVRIWPFYAGCLTACVCTCAGILSLDENYQYGHRLEQSEQLSPTSNYVYMTFTYACTCVYTHTAVVFVCKSGIEMTIGCTRRYAVEQY